MWLPRHGRAANAHRAIGRRGACRQPNGQKAVHDVERAWFRLAVAAGATSTELLSITFLRSGGRLSYFAWFITTAKIVFDMVGMPAGVSVCVFAISSILPFL